MNYINFLSNNWRFLAFGIAANFFASSGQTYFISIFGNEFRQEFSLTNSELGLLYMLATISSALSLIWIGRLIDKIDLRVYTLFVTIAMIAAIFFTSSVINMLSLGLAFYFLRLLGQGLLNHIAVTSMGRYYYERRGTAISISAFGDTIGVALYPFVGVILVVWLGWQETWVVLGYSYLFLALPLMLWLLKGHDNRHQRYLLDLNKKTAKRINPKRAEYSVRSIIKELRFYLLLPAFLSPSFFMTGLIFHQAKIVEIKGWSMIFFSSGFFGLAIASFLTSLLLGPVVDRWKAINLLPFILFPLILALLILNISNDEYIGFIYLILLGVSLGATFTVTESIWPELYGTIHLGGIKSFTRALSVFSSALAPWIIGLLFDIGITIIELSWISISLILVSSILAKISQFIFSKKL